MKYIHKLIFLLFLFMAISINVSAKNYTLSTPKATNIGIEIKQAPIEYRSLERGISDDPGCDGLLGGEMTKVVNNIFKTVQYAAPILVAVFTIIDFAKAALTGEADDMKKASQKFPKRAICAILLFFVPLICSMIFSIAGITVPETCIGK